MKNKNEEILIDLFFSSDEASDLTNDPEIKESIKKGMAFLAPYRKLATAEKAAQFKNQLKETGISIALPIQEISKLFDRLLNGDFGKELRDRGLGYCRNSKDSKITDEEKRIILAELGLLDRKNE